MSRKNKSFILVSPLVYTQIEGLIDRYNNTGEDALPKIIDPLVLTGNRSETNPIPDKNAVGIFWKGDLILREGL